MCILEDLKTAVRLRSRPPLTIKPPITRGLFLLESQLALTVLKFNYSGRLPKAFPSCPISPARIFVADTC